MINAIILINAERTKINSVAEQLVQPNGSYGSLFS